MAVEFNSEQEYLMCVNAFYRFYKQHRYDYPDNFLVYLDNTPLKARLSFNSHLKEFLFKS